MEKWQKQQKRDVWSLRTLGMIVCRNLGLVSIFFLSFVVSMLTFMAFFGLGSVTLVAALTGKFWLDNFWWILAKWRLLGSRVITIMCRVVMILTRWSLILMVKWICGIFWKKSTKESNVRVGKIESDPIVKNTHEKHSGKVPTKLGISVGFVRTGIYWTRKIGMSVLKIPILWVIQAPKFFLRMGKFILPNLWETKILNISKKGFYTDAGKGPGVPLRITTAGGLCEMLMSPFKGAPGGLGLPGTPLALGSWLESGRRSVLSVVHGSRGIKNATHFGADFEDKPEKRRI